MSKEKQIEERLELSDIIDYAIRDWDDYVEECHEEGNSPIDTFEEFIADAVIGAGYRKQSDIVDEFAKKLKDYPIEVRLPLLGLETKEEIEEYVNKLFDQIESIVDKIAEEMKGGYKEQTPQGKK